MGDVDSVLMRSKISLRWVIRSCSSRAQLRSKRRVPFWVLKPNPLMNHSLISLVPLGVWSDMVCCKDIDQADGKRFRRCRACFPPRKLHVIPIPVIVEGVRLNIKDGVDHILFDLFAQGTWSREWAPLEWIERALSAKVNFPMPASALNGLFWRRSLGSGGFLGGRAPSRGAAGARPIQPGPERPGRRPGGVEAETAGAEGPRWKRKER